MCCSELPRRRRHHHPPPPPTPPPHPHRRQHPHRTHIAASTPTATHTAHAPTAPSSSAPDGRSTTTVTCALVRTAITTAIFGRDLWPIAWPLDPEGSPDNPNHPVDRCRRGSRHEDDRRNCGGRRRPRAHPALLRQAGRHRCPARHPDAARRRPYGRSRPNLDVATASDGSRTPAVQQDIDASRIPAGHFDRVSGD